MQIPGLHGIGVGTLLTCSVKDFFEDDMTTYAAALAYQVLFAIFPFILFLITLLGFLDRPDFFDWLREQAQVFLPRQAMQQVDEVIYELQERQGGLLSFSMIVALWSASSGIRATMHALNVAYAVDEGRPAWKRYPLSIMYTFGIVAMLVLAAILLIIGPQAMQWLAYQLRLEQLFVMVWTWLRWPAAVLLLMIAVAIVYYVTPDVEQPFRLITPGAVLAVTGWVIASLAFSYYVRNFADYSVMYGSIGTIIVLLLYFYISASTLLFGAEVNAVIESHARSSKQPDQQTAKQQHMRQGNRGK